MPVEHVSDFGEPPIEFGSKSWKLRHQPPTVELPHLRKTLPPPLGRAGQLRELLDQAPPGVLRFPCFVAVNLRAVEQTTKTRAHLRGLSPERFHLHIVRLTNCRREIARGELTMDGHQSADCIFKDFTGAGRPNQEPDQAVAQDAQCSFLCTEYDRLKIIGSVGAAGEREERNGEPGHVPEIPSGRAEHLKGAEADKDAHASQEQPAFLREQSNKSEGRQAPQECSRQPQQALVQGLADSRQRTERHRKAGPIRIVPVHGKGNAIGKHRGKRCLYCGLDPIRKYSLVGHVLPEILSHRQNPYRRLRDPIVSRTTTSFSWSASRWHKALCTSGNVGLLPTGWRRRLGPVSHKSCLWHRKGARHAAPHDARRNDITGSSAPT